MRLEVGSKIEFTYTDAEGRTQHWSGTVRSAAPEKPYFRLDTGEGFPRTFRYDRVKGEIGILAVS